jgi:hypothetical protein
MIRIGKSKYQVLPETAEETLSEVDKNCLIMVKTNGPNLLTRTNKREGSKGDFST